MPQTIGEIIFCQNTYPFAHLNPIITYSSPFSPFQNHSSSAICGFVILLIRLSLVSVCSGFGALDKDSLFLSCLEAF